MEGGKRSTLTAGDGKEDASMTSGPNGTWELETWSFFDLFQNSRKIKENSTPNYFLKIFFFLAHSIKNRRRAGRHRAGPRKYWGRNLVGKKNSANKLDISNFLLARTGPREPSRNFFRSKSIKNSKKFHPSLSFVFRLVPTSSQGEDQHTGATNRDLYYSQE